jgi:energy-coupling factor transporter transmembrane protein EcfT
MFCFVSIVLGVLIWLAVLFSIFFANYSSRSWFFVSGEVLIVFVFSIIVRGLWRLQRRLKKQEKPASAGVIACLAIGLLTLVLVFYNSWDSNQKFQNTIKEIILQKTFEIAKYQSDWVVFGSNSDYEGEEFSIDEDTWPEEVKQTKEITNGRMSKIGDTYFTLPSRHDETISVPKGGIMIKSQIILSSTLRIFYLPIYTKKFDTSEIFSRLKRDDYQLCSRDGTIENDRFSQALLYLNSKLHHGKFKISNEMALGGWKYSSPYDRELTNEYPIHHIDPYPSYSNVQHVGEPADKSNYESIDLSYCEVSTTPPIQTRLPVNNSWTNLIK